MKDRWTFIVLAFFLGGLGIHRFYLKQYLLGIIYLLFCWTLIPAIIALIEAIIFMFKDENTFNEKYNGFKSK